MMNDCVAARPALQDDVHLRGSRDREEPGAREGRSRAALHRLPDAAASRSRTRRSASCRTATNPDKEATFKALQDYILSAGGPGKGRGVRPPAVHEHRALAPGRGPEGLRPGLGRPVEPPGADDHLPGRDRDPEGARQLPARLPAARRTSPTASTARAAWTRQRRLERRPEVREAAVRPGARPRSTFLQIGAHDRTTVIVFSDRIDFDQTVRGNAPTDLADAAARSSLPSRPAEARRSTTACRRRPTARRRPRAARKKLIVLMTDGQNNSGLDHLPVSLANGACARDRDRLRRRRRRRHAAADRRPDRRQLHPSSDLVAGPAQRNGLQVDAGRIRDNLAASRAWSSSLWPS